MKIIGHLAQKRIAGVFSALGIFALSAYFQEVRAQEGKLDINNLEVGDLQGILIKMANLFAVILPAIAALILILLSGFYYITSQGDEGKLQKARSTATYAVYGFILVFVAGTIIILLGNFLGYPVDYTPRLFEK